VSQKESEVAKSGTDPIWEPFKISLAKMFANDFERPAYVFVKEGEKIIGKAKITCKDLIDGKKQFNLEHPKTSKNNGVLKILQFKYTEEASFLQYLRGGI